MKVRSSKFCPVRKQKVQLRNQSSCVNCRAFHAASHGIFCLSIPCVKGSKIAMQLIMSTDDDEMNLFKNLLPLHYVKYDQTA